MNYKTILPALAMSVSIAAAQATWDSANVPQPHLAAALALAAQENSWRHPGLVSCYWAEGVSAQDANKEETGRSYEAFDKSFARLGPILETAKVDGYIAAHTNYDDAPFKIEMMRHNPPTLPNPFLVGTARVVLFTKMSRECNLNNADLHRAMPNLKAY
jgi:hypothetical protein